MVKGDDVRRISLCGNCLGNGHGCPLKQGEAQNDDGPRCVEINVIRITISMPVSWLTDAEREFPVVIDPTISL